MTLAATKRYYATQRAYKDGVTDVGFMTPENFAPYNIRVQWVDSTTPRGRVQNWLNTARADKPWLLLVYHEIGMSIGHDTFNTATTDLDAEMKLCRQRPWRGHGQGRSPRTSGQVKRK